MGQASSGELQHPGLTTIVDCGLLQYVTVILGFTVFSTLPQHILLGFPMISNLPQLQDCSLHPSASSDYGRAVERGAKSIHQDFHAGPGESMGNPWGIHAESMGNPLAEARSRKQIFIVSHGWFRSLFRILGGLPWFTTYWYEMIDSCNML